MPYDEPAPADVLLSDGSIATICPMGPGHLEGVADLHRRTSAENLRLRFFSTGDLAATRYVEHLAGSTGTISLVAVRDGRVVGVGTAEPSGSEEAEVAFLVDDTLHGLGLGSLLLEHLAAAGRRRGIGTFTAEVLVENHQMLAVLADAGFTARRSTASGCIEVALETRLSAAAQEAADRREDASERRSLEPLLAPRHVAVAGVRRDGTGVGAAVLTSILDGGYDGEVHVVHPDAREVCGVPASPSVAAVPGRVDLLVVAVPAAAVLPLLGDAAAARVRAAVVLTSGFDELGAEGGRAQADLLALARAHDMRLVGPNCLGVLVNREDLRLNATFSRSVPPRGGVALASQSGGLGILLHELAEELGLGLIYSVSLGNKVDVSGNDLLSAWMDDTRVSTGALYLESFGNPLKFARIARRFSRRKPLLAVVGGRSAGGRRAGASHTAAAATPAVAVDALFAQAGIVGCVGPEDLAETALVLTGAGPPRGRRVGIVSNAGGLGVVAADQADRHGLQVPALGEVLQQRLRGLVTGTSGTSNPVDAGAGSGARELVAIVRELASSGEVDCVVLAVATTRVADLAATWPAVAALRDTGLDVPVVGVVPDSDRPGAAQRGSVPVLSSTDAALRALGHAADYTAWREEEASQDGADDGEVTAGVPAAAIAGLVAEVGEEGGWLDLRQTRLLLDPVGLGPVGDAASSPEGAAAAAGELGYPVAVKVVDPDVQHRTERGLVRVGLRSDGEVLATVRAFEERLGRPPRDVLVQPVVSGVELAVGVVRDPTLGPLLMVAAGGVATDVLDDRAFLLPPVRRCDVRRALHSLRVWPLLDGYRGGAPVDLDSLVGLVTRLAALAVDVPQLAELDVNPLVVSASGCLAVDVTVRLAPSPALDAGVPRRLRDRPAAVPVARP